MSLATQAFLVSMSFSLLVTIPLMRLLYRRDIRLFGKPDLFPEILQRLVDQMWSLVWRRRRCQDIISQWPTFLEELSVTVMAVSYTHLDVYKRQRRYRRAGRFGRSNLCNSPSPRRFFN